MDLESQSLELTWSEIVFNNKKTLLIGALYRPPDARNEYWQDLEDNIIRAKSNNDCNILLLGDLNNNLLDVNAKGNSMFSKLHMTQLINEPTHYTPTSKTLIDFASTTSADLINFSKVNSPSLSNHSDLVVVLSLRKPPTRYTKRKVFDYKKADWAEINQP